MPFRMRWVCSSVNVCERFCEDNGRGIESGQSFENSWEEERDAKFAKEMKRNYQVWNLILLSGEGRRARNTDREDVPKLLSLLSLQSLYLLWKWWRNVRSKNHANRESCNNTEMRQLRIQRKIEKCLRSASSVALVVSSSFSSSFPSFLRFILVEERIRRLVIRRKWERYEGRGKCSLRNFKTLQKSGHIQSTIEKNEVKVLFNEKKKRKEERKDRWAEGGETDITWTRRGWRGGGGRATGTTCEAKRERHCGRESTSSWGRREREDPLATEKEVEGEGVSFGIFAGGGSIFFEKKELKIKDKERKTKRTEGQKREQRVGFAKLLFLQWIYFLSTVRFANLLTFNEDATWLVSKGSSIGCENNVWDWSFSCLGLCLFWTKLKCSLLSNSNSFGPQVVKYWPLWWSLSFLWLIPILFEGKITSSKGFC
jgi:hypothetical protein